MHDLTTRFRVRDYVIETWMQEGLIPQCVWFNGRRYWNSDDINTLITGCTVVVPAKAASSIQRFSRYPFVLVFASSTVALLVTLITG